MAPSLSLGGKPVHEHALADARLAEHDAAALVDPGQPPWRHDVAEVRDLQDLEVCPGAPWPALTID
jgi:hypothetical protein